MAKFKKKSNTSQDIPTAALPDIIFMLLFFFMVTTVLRQTTLLVSQVLPKSTQLSKLEKKSLVSYIYVGKPTQIELGTEPKIQVNDYYIETEDIIQFVNTEKDKLDEAERDQITMAMKVDIESKMGIISDIQEKLREANARKVLYSSLRRVD